MHADTCSFRDVFRQQSNDSFCLYMVVVLLMQRRELLAPSHGIQGSRLCCVNCLSPHMTCTYTASSLTCSLCVDRCLLLQTHPNSSQLEKLWLGNMTEHVSHQTVCWNLKHLNLPDLKAVICCQVLNTQQNVEDGASFSVESNSDAVQ